MVWSVGCFFWVPTPPYLIAFLGFSRKQIFWLFLYYTTYEIEYEEWWYGNNLVVSIGMGLEVISGTRVVISKHHDVGIVQIFFQTIYCFACLFMLLVPYFYDIPIRNRFWMFLFIILISNFGFWPVSEIGSVHYY